MTQPNPENIEILETATEGEKKVFWFLRQAARPQSDYRIWYAPGIGEEGLEPDFLLFGKTIGVLVIEVKDWTLQQILAADTENFTLIVNGKEELRKNPDRQARGYVKALMDSLNKVTEFRFSSGPHEGRLKIPVGRLVAFPNISREEYLNRVMEKLIPLARVIHDNDLGPAGEILNDPSGQKFRDRIKKAFPFDFEGFPQKLIEKLAFLISPSLRFTLPERQGPGKSLFESEIHFLDEDQARQALHLKSGHQIILGPPGSGKTLVLVHRCSQLRQFDHRKERILLVCFNIALVSYLKRLIQEKKIGVGPNGVQVLHFYELCSQVLDQEIRYDNRDSDYYQSIIELALEAVQTGQVSIDRFDAILVDEGQDFSNPMISVLLGLLRPGGDFVIALDGFQDLYRRSCSWKSLGIEAKGRTRSLKMVYRNTVEIQKFSNCFLGGETGVTPQLSLLPPDLSFHGPKPSMLNFSGFQGVEDFLANDISDLINRQEYKRSEIAVLYNDKVYGPETFTYDNREIPGRVLCRGS